MSASDAAAAPPPPAAGAARAARRARSWEETVKRVSMGIVSLRVNYVRPFDGEGPNYSLATGFARVRNRLLLGYWQSWLGVLSKKRKLRQFVQKMRNQRLLVWFNTWIECLDEMQRQHCLLQRSLARVLKATLSRSFDEWEDATRKRIRLRRFMKLALRRWVLAKKRRGIAQWKNHNRIMRICQKEEAARKISAKRIFSRYVHREMASRFDTWIDMVMQRRMLRGLVKKIQNSRMLMRFRSRFNRVNPSDHE